MHLTHLTLTNYRSYAQQEMDLAPGVVLLLGENAQGKTNVLEAVFVLATGRASRASVDAEVIAWDQREEKQPFARIVGKAQRQSGEVTVEATIAGRPGPRGLIATKKFKLNGVAKRAADVTGAIAAVLFTTDDMDLVRGAPSDRRRYMDVMLAQADRAYSRALSAYGKIITQRNALLKRIGEGAAKADELPYWDEELAREGTVILQERARALDPLASWAKEAHTRLSGEREDLEVTYAPRFAVGWDAARIAGAEPDEVDAALRVLLKQGSARDIGAGLTLSGPHRDDITMMLGGEPAASFASRGQQRTAALALRLAEARLLFERTGERPIMLLDDVLSELDEHRRASVLGAIDADQLLITSADADRFPKRFATQTWHVAGGVATLQ